jgi:micrococcal nuclease
MPFEYHAKVVEVVDGDTIVIDIDLGFDIKLTNQKVRLLGIDTPESRTSDKIEKIFGLASKVYVKKFVKDCEDTVIIRTHLSDDVDGNGREKFGRLLGEIVNPKTRKVLNEELISNNYAVKYLGENKLNVADEHKKNRKILIDRKEVKVTYEQAGVK